MMWYVDIQDPDLLKNYGIRLAVNVLQQQISLSKNYRCEYLSAQDFGASGLFVIKSDLLGKEVATLKDSARRAKIIWWD